MLEFMSILIHRVVYIIRCMAFERQKNLHVSVPVYLESGPRMNKSESPLVIHIDLGQHEASKGCILQKFAD